jgi:hypothetical protein
VYIDMSTMSFSNSPDLNWFDNVALIFGSATCACLKSDKKLRLGQPEPHHSLDPPGR